MSEMRKTQASDLQERACHPGACEFCDASVTGSAHDLRLKWSDRATDALNVKRVSDRLPIPARRSRGGKHVAPRTAAVPVVPSATHPAGPAVPEASSVAPAAAADVPRTAPAAGRTPAWATAARTAVPAAPAAPAAPAVPTTTGPTRRALRTGAVPVVTASTAASSAAASSATSTSVASWPTASWSVASSPASSSDPSSSSAVRRADVPTGDPRTTDQRTADQPTADQPTTDTAATRVARRRAQQPRVHVLPRGGRPHTRLAQVGVVAALAVGLGGGLTATVSSRAEATQAATEAAEQAAENAAAAQRADVADAVDIADDVLADSTVVRTEAQQAAVDAARLAELDQAAAHLEALVEAIDDPLEARTRDSASRSDERAPVEEEVDPSSVDTTSGSSAAGSDVTPAPAAPEAVAPVAPATDGAAAAVVDPQSATTDAVRTAAAEVSALAQEVRGMAEANRAAAAAAQAQAEAEAAAAAEAARVAAEQAAQREAWKRSLLGYANGRIPGEALCGVSWDSSVQLRCDAAEALEQLNAEYVAAFGANLTISDSYRSYAGQVACRRTKGWLCAAPGTSNHGTGVAVDFGGGIETFGTKQFAWMQSHAPSFSWTHPTWAARTGSKPEAWHWEYVG